MSIIAVDLDGTLCDWAGDGSQIGPLKEGAGRALASWLADGHSVLIHSCRSTWPAGGGAEAVLAFFAEWGAVPVDQTKTWACSNPVGVWVGEGKPFAHVYIDDRAVNFDAKRGGWKRAAADVEEMLRRKG